MAVITAGLVAAPTGAVPVVDAMATPAPGYVSASPDGDTSATTVPPTSDVPNDFMDLERDLTQCISSNPLPGCGRQPTSPGDRGGWQQFLLFGIMMSGIGIIFWRIVRSIRVRDQAASPSEDVPA